jgi:hypothetical protein
VDDSYLSLHNGKAASVNGADDDRVIEEAIDEHRATDTHDVQRAVAKWSIHPRLGKSFTRRVLSGDEGQESAIVLFDDVENPLGPGRDIPDRDHTGKEDGTRGLEPSVRSRAAVARHAARQLTHDEHVAVRRDREACRGLGRGQAGDFMQPAIELDYHVAAA